MYLSYSDVLVCWNFWFQQQIDFNFHANSMDPDQTAQSDWVQTVCDRDFKNRTLVVKSSERVKYRVTVTPQNMELGARKPVIGFPQSEIQTKIEIQTSLLSYRD